MRYIFTLLMLMLLGFSPLVAQENHSHYYIVTKALYSLGEKVDHGVGKTLESDSGVGIGIDFGYQINHHFAVEFDFSYDENEVEENDNGTLHHADGTYYTYALDATYSHHLSKSLALMGKVGLELEDEQIKELGINTTETGLVYGIALEYLLNKHYEIVTEYEASSIESPRGSSIFVGVKRIF
jgi:opacity protein-like surface antigen